MIWPILLFMLSDAGTPAPKPEISAQAKLELSRIDQESLRLENLRLQIAARQPELVEMRKQSLAKMRAICEKGSMILSEANGDQACVTRPDAAGKGKEEKTK